MYWVKVWLLTSVLAILGISFNETILRGANHQPSLVRDADLFCISYSQLPELEHKDVVLLGASRMQTNFDLNIFQKSFPERKIVQLAQSGRGTAYTVFKDIVKNSYFKGIIIISETESTLISRNKEQQGFVNHCRNSFSLNSQINRNLNSLFQNNFVFLNPQSSSFRLWGNILGQQNLPEPFYTKTKIDRSQLSDFRRADGKALKRLHDSRIQGIKKSSEKGYLNPQEWLEKTNHWQPLVEKFQQRGGRVIFVRMPVSQERWKFESKRFPPDKYWNNFTRRYNVASLHFAEYPSLSQFNLPDTSHLDMRDRSLFTELLLDKLEKDLR